MTPKVGCTCAATDQVENVLETVSGLNVAVFTCVVCGLTWYRFC